MHCVAQTIQDAQKQALERQDLPHTYLAHNELESVITRILIMNVVELMACLMPGPLIVTEVHHDGSTAAASPWEGVAACLHPSLCGIGSFSYTISGNSCRLLCCGTI